MSDNIVWPEGADAMIDGDYFSKWVGGKEFYYNHENKEWEKAAISWTIERYITSGWTVEYPPDQGEVNNPSHYQIQIMPGVIEWPEGAEALIDGDYFSKWVGDKEFYYNHENKEWDKAAISRTIERYITSGWTVEYPPDQDAVNNPSHYQIMPGVEFKDIRRALLEKCDDEGVPAWQIDCWSRSFEYIGRMWGKNGLEDAKKARVYLDWLIEAMESEK